MVLPSEEEIRQQLESIWNEKKKEYNKNPNNERRVAITHSCNKYGFHQPTPFEPICDSCDCHWGQMFHDAMKKEVKNFLNEDRGKRD